jgi:hypothetical protein
MRNRKNKDPRDEDEVSFRNNTKPPAKVRSQSQNSSHFTLNQPTRLARLIEEMIAKYIEADISD